MSNSDKVRNTITIEVKRAYGRFTENVGAAGETHRPTVAANGTTVMIYQRHYRDSGIDVIAIPRGGLNFIALLVEAERDAGSGRTFHVVAVEATG